MPTGQFVSHVPPAIDTKAPVQAAHALPAPSEVNPIAQFLHCPALLVSFSVPAGQFVSHVPPAIDTKSPEQAAHAAPATDVSPIAQSVHAPPAVDVLPAGHFVHAPPAPSDV